MRKKTADEIIGNERLQLREKDTIVGFYRNFQTAMYIPTNSRNYYCTINATVEGDNEEFLMQELNTFLLKLQKSEKQIVSIRYIMHTIEIIAVVPNRVKNLAPSIHNIYDKVTDYLSQCGFRTGCASCGSEVTKNDAYFLNDRVFCMCQTCFDENIRSLDIKKAELRAKKGSVITGIAGALLGAIVGGAVWVGVAQLGYIAVVSAMLLGVLTIFGYHKFGGTMNIFGLIITIVITLAMVFVAHNVSYAIDVKQMMGDMGSPISFKLALTYVKEFTLHEAQFRQAYLKDIIIGYLFTIVAGVSAIVSIYRNARGAYKARKIK